MNGPAWPRKLAPTNRKWPTSAPRVPVARPHTPPAAVIRFQNSPSRNVANSGALKNENSSWM